MERSVGKPHCPCQDCLARIIHNQRGKRAWFKLLGTKVTLCFAELPVSFAANGCGSSGCAKKDAPLCLTKCYPAVNQARKGLWLITTTLFHFRLSVNRGERT